MKVNIILFIIKNMDQILAAIKDIEVNQYIDDFTNNYYNPDDFFKRGPGGCCGPCGPKSKPIEVNGCSTNLVQSLIFNLDDKSPQAKLNEKHTQELCDGYNQSKHLQAFKVDFKFNSFKQAEQLKHMLTSIRWYNNPCCKVTLNIESFSSDVEGYYSLYFSCTAQIYKIELLRRYISNIIISTTDEDKLITIFPFLTTEIITSIRNDQILTEQQFNDINNKYNIQYDLKAITKHDKYIRKLKIASITE